MTTYADNLFSLQTRTNAAGSTAAQKARGEYLMSAYNDRGTSAETLRIFCIAEAGENSHYAGWPKLPIIKALREHFGLSLKGAKDLHDRIVLDLDTESIMDATRTVAVRDNMVRFHKIGASVIEITLNGERIGLIVNLWNRDIEVYDLSDMMVGEGSDMVSLLAAIHGLAPRSNMSYMGTDASLNDALEAIGINPNDLF